MKYTITINEVDEETAVETPRYSQTVDNIDIPAIINAVNSSHPMTGRVRALRSDAGKPRARPENNIPTPVE